MEDVRLLKIIDECITSWNYQGDDLRVLHFKNEYINWINQFPSEYHDYILALTKNIKYYTKKSSNKALSEMHSILLSQGITENDTVYTFLKSRDGISNSSNDYWTEYKILNGINRNLCYEDISAINNRQWEKIKNIVFIDDFVGTGNSIISFLDELNLDFMNKNVFIISVHMMFEAQNRLKEYCDSKHFNIINISSYIQKKAFSSGIFEDNEFVKTKILDLSSQLGITGNDKLGYGESESLVSFFNNTPNNTIAFFWKTTRFLVPILPRVFEKRPSWQNLKEESTKRVKENYDNRSKLKNG